MRGRRGSRMAAAGGALVIAAALTCPPSASATTVYTTQVLGTLGHSVEPVYAQAKVTADPGETNDLQITVAAGTVTVHDAGADVRLADGERSCTAIDARTARCTGIGPLYPYASEDDVVVDAGDLADTVRIDGTGRSRVSGGSGDDHVVGGDGPDTLVAGPGHDMLGGSGGADELVLDGDDGSDVLDGGSGTDAVAAGTSTARVDLGAGTAQTRGAPDRVTAVEVALGGPGADDLRGTDGRDELRGMGGPDVLVGRGGDDTIDVGILRDAAGQDDLEPDVIGTPDPARETVVCGPGDDVVVRSDAADHLEACESVDGPARVEMRPTRRTTRTLVLGVTLRPGALPVTLHLVEPGGRRHTLLGRSRTFSGTGYRRVTVRLGAPGRRLVALPGTRRALVRVIVPPGRADAAIVDEAVFGLRL